MDVEIVINNLQDRIEISEDFQEQLIQYVTCAFDYGDVEDGEVCITFVDDEYISRLNESYRNISGPTDVLSFPMNEEGLIGDVVISLETATRQAEEYGHSLEEEVAFLAVHGVLHLLGYDHETPEEEEKMMQISREVLGRARF